MTNEQLAGFIKQGGNDELIPILWENVRKLMHSNSRRFYATHKAKCDSSGVELWDLYQVCYTAFLEAVKGFKPESGLKFTSFLKYPFRNAVNELIGLRTSRTIHEPLNNSTSLDKPLDSSEDDVITLLDTLADDTALDFIQRMETASVGATVRAVIETLQEQHREVIKLRYFEGLTLKQTGERLGVSPERVRQRESMALRILRQNKILRELWKDFCSQRYRTSFSWFRTSPEYYFALKRAERKPLSYGQRQAELYEAQLIWESQQKYIR